MKIYKRDLHMALLCFTFFALPLPHYLFLALKYGILCYLFLIYFKMINKLRGISAAVILYGIIVLVSSLYNHMGINIYVSSLEYTIKILVTYLVVSAYGRENIRALSKTLLMVLGFFVLITDLLLFILPYNFLYAQEAYFVGTKFQLSYLHGFLLCLYMLYCNAAGKKKNKWLLGGSCVWSVVVTQIVQCTTGTVMCLLILVMALLPKKIWRILSDWRAVLLAFLVINILIFGETQILTNSKVQYIVTEIFHKNPNLTGRLLIYEYLPTILKDGFILGYGYNNTLIAEYMGTYATNAQNGIFKIIMDSGLLGLFSYIAILVGSLKRKGHFDPQSIPLFIFLYAMICISSIEINITGPLFFLTLAFLFLYRSKTDCTVLV